MYILDTNTLKFHLYEPEKFPQLKQKIKIADAKGLLCTSIVAIEEICSGHIRQIRDGRKQKESDILASYFYFWEFVNDLSVLRVLPFDKKAHASLGLIRKPLRDRHMNDCRMASIAIAQNYTLVTHDGDFDDIKASVEENGGKLELEDWIEKPLE